MTRYQTITEYSITTQHIKHAFETDANTNVLYLLNGLFTLFAQHTRFGTCSDYICKDLWKIYVTLQK